MELWVSWEVCGGPPMRQVRAHGWGSRRSKNPHLRNEMWGAQQVPLGMKFLKLFNQMLFKLETNYLFLASQLLDRAIFHRTAFIGRALSIREKRRYFLILWSLSKSADNQADIYLRSNLIQGKQRKFCDHTFDMKSCTLQHSTLQTR